jgi:hypothetical protein
MEAVHGIFAGVALGVCFTATILVFRTWHVVPARFTLPRLVLPTGTPPVHEEDPLMMQLAGIAVKTVADCAFGDRAALLRGQSSNVAATYAIWCAREHVYGVGGPSGPLGGGCDGVSDRMPVTFLQLVRACITDGMLLNVPADYALPLSAIMTSHEHELASHWVPRRRTSYRQRRDDEQQRECLSFKGLAETRP